MRLFKKLASVALSAVIAIGVCGLCPAPLFAQDTTKSSKRVEHTDKKKARAKQSAASRSRNTTTGASQSPQPQATPGFPVNGY